MSTTNSTSTSRPQGTDPPDTSTTSKRSSSTANPPTTASTPDPTTSPSPTSASSTPPSSTPPTSSPTSEPTTSNPPSKTTTTPPPSSTPDPTTSKSEPPTRSGESTSTVVTTITSPRPSQTGDSTTLPTSSSTTGAAINPSGGSSGGLNDKGKIAVAVVVPIAAVALLVLAGIYFWRKRKQRKDAAEQARKEVEDYGYNPNADPTIPNVGPAGGPFEMVKEDASSGYRGWGSTTLASSTGRKASTTMSGGPAGAAYSDAPSPTRGNVSDTRSGEPLMHDGSQSPEGEILGAMGPSAAANRADVHRGPSNASSSYSAAGRSDGSGEGPGGYGGGAQYYDQYGNSNPYTDRPGGPADGAAQPVIRDVTARRNTRIENSGHYAQQSAGISQNF